VARGPGLTFEDDKNKANVAKLHERILPLNGHDISDRNAIDETDNDLADEPGLENLIREPFREGEKKEEGNKNEERNDYWWLAANLHQIATCAAKSKKTRKKLAIGFMV